jgi:hypothetical protein
MPTLKLFAPDTYPTKRTEIRAYTIAAFRVAQGSDQLSLVPMSKPIVDFLTKRRAVGYWKEQGWLEEQEGSYRLTAPGLVTCQSALANQLPSHNTSATHVSYWETQFRHNTDLPRHESFEG